jgi:hypothetical protein
MKHKVNLLILGNGYIELIDDASGQAVPVYQASADSRKVDLEIGLDDDTDMSAFKPVLAIPNVNALARYYLSIPRRLVRLERVQ